MIFENRLNGSYSEIFVDMYRLFQGKVLYMDDVDEVNIHSEIGSAIITQQYGNIDIKCFGNLIVELDYKRGLKFFIIYNLPQEIEEDNKEEYTLGEFDFEEFEEIVEN